MQLSGLTRCKGCSCLFLGVLSLSGKKKTSPHPCVISWFFFTVMFSPEDGAHLGSET